MGKGLEQREINLWDMLWAVCLKWRSILVCAVILAMLAGGLSYVRNAQSLEAENKEISLEDMEKALDYESKKSLEVYFEYMDAYESQKKYNETAPIMQLDANAFYKGEVSYYIDNNFKVEYPLVDTNNAIVALVNTYKAALNSQGFLDEAKEVLGEQLIENQYVTEMIDFMNAYGDTTTIETNEAEGVLTISVYANDEETCYALKELVKESINAYQKEAGSQFGKHDLVLLQDVCEFVADEDLLDYQKRNVDRMQTSANYMTSFESKFSTQQFQYKDLYLKNNGKENGSAVQEATSIKESPIVSIKLVLIGYVGGAVLMFGLWALLYIFSSKLRLEDDYELVFESKLLGNVPMEKKTKRKWFWFIDFVFEKLRHFNKRYFEKEEALDMIAANIRIAMQKANACKVMVTGAVCGDDEKNVAEQIASRLKKDGIEIVFGNSILYDAEALEKLVELGSVVLVEKAEKSLYKEIQREIEICLHQGVNLVGSVVVY